MIGAGIIPELIIGTVGVTAAKQYSGNRGSNTRPYYIAMTHQNSGESGNKTPKIYLS